MPFKAHKIILKFELLFRRPSKRPKVRGHCSGPLTLPSSHCCLKPAHRTEIIKAGRVPVLKLQIQTDPGNPEMHKGKECIL